MQKIKYLFLLLLPVAFGSCKDKPSDTEVKNCLLKQFDCADKIVVTSMEIENSRQVPDMMGQKQYEFIVSGEIEYVSNCQSFFQTIYAGTRQKIKSKHVFLYKMDKGWDCP